MVEVLSKLIWGGDILLNKKRGGNKMGGHFLNFFISDEKT